MMKNTLAVVSEPAQALSSSSVFMSVFGSLAFIILLIGALAWGVRRSGLTKRLNVINGEIAVVATRSLGSRERLVLVDIGEQRLVLGVTPAQVTCLSVCARPEAVAPAETEGSIFPALLDRLFLKERTGGKP